MSVLRIHAVRFEIMSPYRTGKTVDFETGRFDRGEVLGAIGLEGADVTVNRSAHVGEESTAYRVVAVAPGGRVPRTVGSIMVTDVGREQEAAARRARDAAALKAELDAREAARAAAERAVRDEARRDARGRAMPPGTFKFRGIAPIRDDAGHADGSDVVETSDRGEYLALLRDRFGVRVPAGVRADVAARRRTTRRPAAPRPVPVTVWDPKPLDPGAWVEWTEYGETRTGQVWSVSGKGNGWMWVIPAERRPGDVTYGFSALELHARDLTAKGFDTPDLFDDVAVAVEDRGARVEPSDDRVFRDVAQVRAHWAAGGDDVSNPARVESLAGLALEPLSTLTLGADGGLVVHRTGHGWEVLHCGTGKTISGGPFDRRKDAVEAVRLYGMMPVPWGAGEDMVAAALQVGGRSLSYPLQAVIALIGSGRGTEPVVAEMLAKVAADRVSAPDAAPSDGIPAPVEPVGAVPVVGVVHPTVADPAPLPVDDRPDTSVIPDDGDVITSDPARRGGPWSDLQRDYDRAMIHAPHRIRSGRPSVFAHRQAVANLGMGVLRDAAAWWRIADTAGELLADVQACATDIRPGTILERVLVAVAQYARVAAMDLKATARTMGFVVDDYQPPAVEWPEAVTAPAEDPRAGDVPEPTGELMVNGAVHADGPPSGDWCGRAGREAGGMSGMRPGARAAPMGCRAGSSGRWMEGVVMRDESGRDPGGRPSLGADGRRVMVPVSAAAAAVVSARYAVMVAARPPEVRAWARGRGMACPGNGPLPRVVRDAYRAAFPGAGAGRPRAVARADAVRAVMRDGVEWRAAHPGRACGPGSVPVGQVTERVFLDGALAAAVDGLARSVGVSVTMAARMLVADGVAVRGG